MNAKERRKAAKSLRNRISRLSREKHEILRALQFLAHRPKTLACRRAIIGHKSELDRVDRRLDASYARLKVIESSGNLGVNYR